MHVFFKNSFISLCAFLIFFGKGYSDEPFRVLIIGGGPAGLATALEAHAAGATPILIERRFSCKKESFLFLDTSSLNLLQKWEIQIPQMEHSRSFAMLKLSDLKEGLSERVNALGIARMRGEFMGFMHDGILLVTEHDGVLIHCELLIGADGTHSSVREALRIPIQNLGNANGAVALLPNDEPYRSPREAVHLDDLFLHKIPFGSQETLILAQSSHKKLTKEFLGQKLLSIWPAEGNLLLSNKALNFSSFDVPLQQAESFTCEHPLSLLVGNAAASASFFQAQEINTALQSAVLAGTCIEQLLKHDSGAIKTFEEAMKKRTDWMIDDSRYLYESTTPELPERRAPTAQFFP